MRRLPDNRHRIAPVAAAAAMLVAACSATLPPPVPDGALRLAQIVAFLRASDILADERGPELLRKIGRTPESLGDRSFALARVRCCGGPNEQDTAIAVHVPDGIAAGPADVGDVVEVRAGTREWSADRGEINVALRVRAKAGSDGCRWLPEDPSLWTRTLYCDGLEAEGWVEQKGFWHFWIRPAGP